MLENKEVLKKRLKNKSKDKLRYKTILIYYDGTWEIKYVYAVQLSEIWDENVDKMISKLESYSEQFYSCKD